MEGRIYLYDIDIFNILNDIKELAASDEEADLYKKAADTWFNNRGISNTLATVLPIEYKSINISAKGKITIK